jgi:hypothetical protein
MNKINRSGSIPKLELEWLEQGRSHIQSMSRMEQNEYLDTLYQIGKSEISNGERAAEVF